MEKTKSEAAAEGKEEQKEIEAEELKAKLRNAVAGGSKFFIAMAIFTVAYLVLGWTETTARLWAESTGHEWLGAPITLIQYLGCLLGI